MSNCYNCKSKRAVPGNAHIACATPDVNMTGHYHGVANGWFMYPYCFDPVWIAKECDNYAPKGVDTSSK